MKFTPWNVSLSLVIFALLIHGRSTASAQSAPSAEPAARAAVAQELADINRRKWNDSHPLKTFHLKSAGTPNEGNEILTGIRLMVDPSTRIYFEPSRNIIIVRGTTEELALAEKLIDEFDLPAKLFRITYTVTESDAGKRIGLQHFSLVVAAGQKAVLKDGSRVPVVTGSYGASAGEKSSGVQTQFTYLDVGMNFDASLAIDGMTLQTKVEQSSVAEQRSIDNVQEPIIRQSVLQGTTILTPGKPQTLGSLDVPGSTRHLDIEVLLEPVK